MLRPVSVAAALLAALLIAGPACAQALNLTGLAGQTATLSAADIAALPHQSVTLSHEGKATVYSGPTLATLLERVGAPLGKALRGAEMADLVRVTCADGYQVALALAEADPGMRADPIILADRADGAPLSPSEAPYRLVVQGDLRPARSARAVTAILVERVGAGR